MVLDGEPEHGDADDPAAIAVREHEMIRRAGQPRK